MPSRLSVRVVLALIAVQFTSLCTAGVVLVPFGSTWKYKDDGQAQVATWRDIVFLADTAWANGTAEFGYGDGDEITTVSYGPSSSSKYVTTYFRHSFTIANAAQFTSYLLRFRRDDGIVVYVNGQEVARSNMPTGMITNSTLASTAISGTGESTAIDQVLATSWFQTGVNTIAVEIHQQTTNSTDITFDLQLKGIDSNPDLSRGPCLHITTPTSAVLKWKTTALANGRVCYGTTMGVLTDTLTVPALTLDHEVTLTGLQPSTTYYYTIGTSTSLLEGGDATYFLRTSPPQASQTPLRIWVIGDAGTATVAQRRVRTAYLDHVGANIAQAWIWLGDNAYQSGTELEFQTAVFENMYEPILRNTTLWPAPGNHDYASGASAANNTGPYYDLFAMPKNGQAGGVASNTEAYYSYDIGNVHMISLDSHDSPRSATGAMATWLTNDLADARKRQEWIVAYWHHPPYTKGNHNSDDFTDPRSGDMRQNIDPILEANGVDLVLCGHSHTYERSFLINGHYGVSSTFNAGTMGVDMTSGRADGTGAYQKPGDLAPNAGAVYTVCGVAGQKEPGGSLNHPVMYMSTGAQLGSMLLDFTGTTLSAQFINEVGTLVDHFDIVKGPTHVKLMIKVFLDGAYDGSALMKDDLRVNGLIPTTQPHTGIFPLVGEGGSGTIAPAVLATTGANAIVDWVFVELRDRNNPALVLDSRSALVQRDGDVVDLDGTSPLAMAVPVGLYHVAIRHRNHLGAMTAQPVPLDRVALPIDFRTAATLTWGINARKDVSGTMVLWAGNCVPDGVVKYTGTNSDRSAVLTSIGGVVPTNSSSGYKVEDLNMDGVVKYTGLTNDRDVILTNIGSVVPTNTVIEQLP